MAGCFQTPEWYVDGQPARYHAGKGGGFVGLPGIGHVAGHALWINVVLEANAAHVKALYRRGMASLEVGDFEEARGDFEMMMKADKSFEPDATAAFKKLKQKQKQQDVEKKARRQFKGLFDKMPGEIADAGTDNRGEEQSTNENHQEKDGSLSCGQLVEDFFQLLGFKDARYYDKALGLGVSSIISSSGWQIQTSKAKKHIKEGSVYHFQCGLTKKINFWAPFMTIYIHGKTKHITGGSLYYFH